MGKNKNIDNRSQVQNEEPYTSQDTGLPKDRFSDEVQVATAPETKTDPKDTGASNTPGSDKLTASTAAVVKKKMSIRPSSEAGLSEGKQIGGVPLGDTIAVRGVAGVSRVNVAVDESKNPYSKGGYRPTQRYDKKNSQDNFIINNQICEQIEPVFEESKDLREAPDAAQGYNGRKQFTSARGKKNAGEAPGSLLFDRSIDFVEHGSVVHTTGQVIDNITAKAGYPTTSQADANSEPVEIENAMKKSNYLLKAFTFTLSNTGLITNPHFDEDQYIVDGQDVAIEASNLNWQVDANNVAKTVIKLQTELGRETTDKWSPLGYVISNPYEYNMLAHDIEATCGAIVGAAYKSASASLAFNLNKMGKDGAKSISPIVEMFAEGYEDAKDSTIYDNKGISHIFNTTAYAKGSAAAIIHMFDSVNKYSTKADFFNQQRSLKFHLQNVDNNLNPLHAKKEFFKALDSEYLFSTEDGNYNPMLPIHYTSDLKIMNPLSLDFFLTGWKDVISDGFDASVNNPDTGMTSIYNYAYRDVRNNYSWSITHPVVAGLMRWLMRHRSNLVKAYFHNSSSTSVNITWPINFGMKAPNMFNFAICSASQDILYCRNVIFRDILFAGEQSTYIWEDLSSMTDLNPLYASQYTYTDYGSCLKLGSMRADKKIRVFFPEKIEFRIWEDGTVGSNNSNSYILPWYYNELSIGDDAYDNTGFLSSNTPYVMSMPSIRQGVNHDAVDLLYSMSEEDLRLSLDRMTDIPVYTYYDSSKKTFTALCGKGRVTKDTITWIKKNRLNAVRYDKVSDGRLRLTCSISTDDMPRYLMGLREETYYCTPRELGYIFPLIPRYARPVVTALNGNDTRTISHKVDRYIDGSSFCNMIAYRALGSDLNAQSIDRSAALQQKWTKLYAYRDKPIVDTNLTIVQEYNILPSIACFIDGLVDLNSAPTLDTNLTEVNAHYAINSAQLFSAGETKVVTLQRFMFTILQRVFFPISLFDDAFDANTETGTDLGDIPSATPLIDPMEACFYFGFAGCLGSDFNQCVLERLNIKDELNMYYLEDEFIKKSLIFRA